MSRSLISLFGVALCSPISAFLLLWGSGTAICTCYILGMDTDLIAGGYYSSEAAFASLAVGGLFFV
jgi:urea transporter